MSKQQIFYIHGGGSFQNHDDFLTFLRTREVRDLPDREQLKKWTNTLREDLGGAYEVFTPSMPNSQNARYEEWKIWFERYFDYLHDGVILIGWSLGGFFLSKYLIENKPPFEIKALFLLAAPFEPFVDELEDCTDFAFAKENIEILSTRAKKIVVFHSKDDFVVPYAHALEYTKHLSTASLMSFDDKNHFLTDKFPELLEKIREVSH